MDKNRSKNILNALTVLFATSLVFLFVYISEQNKLLIVFLLYLVMVVVVKIEKKNLKIDFPLLEVTRFSFVVIAFISMTLLINFRLLYNVDFCYANDDSFYFYEIYQIIQGNEVTSGFSIWKRILVLFYNTLRMFNLAEDLELLHLLPLNWLFSALACGLSIYLAAYVGRTEDKKYYRLSLPLFLLLSHYVITVNSGLLYRDALLLFTSVSSLLFAFKKKYLSALIFVFLSGLIRGGNGFILLLAVIFIYMGQLKYFQKSYRLIVFFVIIFVGLGYFMMETLNLNQYMRSFARQDTVFEDVTIREQANERLESRLTNVQKTGTTDYLYNKGIVGKAILPAISLFAPVRFISLFEVKKINIYGSKSFWMPGIYVINFWQNVYIISLILTGPIILFGIYKIYKSGSINSKSLLLYYFIVVFSIALVSNQDRHRMAFLVLNPIFAYFIDFKDPRDRRIVLLLASVFILGISAINII